MSQEVEEIYKAFKNFKKAAIWVGSTLLVLILLETGALIYGKATDRADIDNNEESISELSAEMTEFAKTMKEISLSNNEVTLKLTMGVVENKTNINAIQNYIDH